MGKDKLIIIAGPCLIEGKEMLFRTAEKLVSVTSKLDIDFVFKSSYRKANRTSAGAFSGIGDDTALQILNDVKTEFGIPVLTDIHLPEEAEKASQVEAAADTGKIVNIKKAQFMAPEDVIKAAEKVKARGNNNIMLTERGTFFGYHDLVVDFRAMKKMMKSGYPVIYDATHSMQQPSVGEQSGGYPEFTSSIAYSALCLGINGIFFETHPEPSKAKSDSATQLPLADAEHFITNLYNLYNFLKENEIA